MMPLPSPVVCQTHLDSRKPEQRSPIEDDGQHCLGPIGEPFHYGVHHNHPDRSQAQHHPGKLPTLSALTAISASAISSTPSTIIRAIQNQGKVAYECQLSWSRTRAARPAWPPANQRASHLDRWPAARGRCRVLSTWRSMSRSHISLMVQPNPLMRKAPEQKRAASCGSGRAPAGAAAARAHKPGNRVSHVPMGRSTRISRR